jgi:N-acetylglucosaminyl-diphospho-decaprenol L-rhamnosyltransferase
MISSVGVVVVNYNGDPFVLDCWRSLQATAWRLPIEVVVVDNASTDGSRMRLVGVGANVLDSGRNGGFGAGCNVGIAALRRCDAIALVNSDAFVEPGWLTPLVEALEADESVGASVPLTVFVGQWNPVEIRSPLFVPGAADRRQLGVQVTAVANGLLLGRGFHPAEAGFRWSSANVATLYVSSDTKQLEVVCPNGALIDGVEVPASPSAQSVVLAQHRVGVDVIDNAGVRLKNDWWGDECAHLDTTARASTMAGPIELWSGGAVLFRREFLDDVGLFDEPMFLYYEDTDLALRGRRLGWTYAIEPKSVVRHGHGWSTGGSANPMARYCTERNRLVVIARHAPLGTAAKQWTRHVLAIACAARHRNKAETKLLARALAGAIRAVIRGPQPKWQKPKRIGRYRPVRSEISSD